MDTIERTAKTVEDAITGALRSLDANRDDVLVTVLDEGSKGGIFGIGSKPARVLVRRKPDPISAAKNFLREVTLAMGLSVAIETNKKDKHVYINMIGENMGVLIGKRGKTLDSLQYLTNLAVNRCGVPEISVILDTENYRKRRRETLEGLAVSLARKVKSTGKGVVLEPMSRYERHIIHVCLQNDRFVKTHSEGDEPYRNVIISPK
jgi:spoIIIJ-associated protein